MSSPSHQSGAGHSAYSFCWRTFITDWSKLKFNDERSMAITVACDLPIVSSKDINGIPVCHNSVLAAPAYKSANEGQQNEVKLGEGRCVLPPSSSSSSVNVLPCADELITRRKSSPTMDSLKRAKIECQIFHTVRTTVVEIYTRGHFGWFTGHCCLLIRSNYSSGPLIYGNVHRCGHRIWTFFVFVFFWLKSHF